MRRWFGVSVILLLGMGVFAPRLEAQASSGRDRGSQLKQNYPNPFNPVTRIPFELGPEEFRDGRPAVVTIRIYSILRELVAVPTALNHTGNGQPIEKLEYYTPGEYEAYWDGTDKNGRKVGSGLYIVQLEINGRRLRPITMTVAK